MFCKYCSSELHDDAKFCNNCGAPVEKENPAPQYNQQTNYSAPAYPQQPYNYAQNNAGMPVSQPPVTTKKSSNGCIIAIIIVAVLAVLLIVGVIALGVLGANLTKSDTQTVSDSFISEDSFDTQEANSAYTEIFTSHNIVEAPYLFFNLDSRCFANIDSDGMIEKMEFGYDGDTIKELNNVIYYPIDGYTDDLIESLDGILKDTFAQADALDCCTVTYSSTSSYYIVTVHSTDLDNISNLSALSDAGVLTYDGFALYLSMEETATALLGQGYIER